MWIRDDEDTAHTILRGAKSLLAALENDVETWDAQHAQGPPYPSVYSLPQLVRRAWERHGDQKRAEQALTFLAPVPT